MIRSAGRHVLALPRLALALAALVALAAASPAAAGTPSPREATCQFWADGSGYCSGTLRAFRNSSNTSAQLIIQSYVSTTGTSRYVQVLWSGTSKFLPLASGAPAELIGAIDRAATAVDANVYVHWNTSGRVDAFQLFNDSGLL